MEGSFLKNDNPYSFWAFFPDGVLTGTSYVHADCYPIAHSHTNTQLAFIYLFIFALGKPAGAKGFSLSSYGSGASTVEPFLIDEKKITGKHVVFWVEKRLAAQGIIPVWKD